MNRRFARLAGNARRALMLPVMQPKKLILASMCDILFFVAYGFITAPLFAKIVQYIAIIGTFVSENAASLARGQSASLGSVVVSDPEAGKYFRLLLLVYTLAAISIYAVYTFFHGISWKMSSEIAGRKISMHKYMKRFAILSIFWFLLFAAYHFLSLFSDLRQAAIESMQAEPGGVFAGFVFLVLLAIIYFATLSYALIRKKDSATIKKSFSIGARKAADIMPAYAAVAVVYFALVRLLSAVAETDANLMVAIGIFTIIPAMTWARVFITLAAEKLK